MFKMCNPCGSAVISVKTERRRDELLSRGFTLEEQTEGQNFDNMKVNELEAFAKEKGIDLSECKNKAEKLEKIKNSMEA